MPKNPFQMAFPDAISFFKKKRILPSDTWKQVSEQYQAIAFTIASITRLSILADIQEAIAAQLEKGISPEAFRESFQELMVRRGWSPNFSPYRIGLILSQNARQSMAYGRFEQMRSPQVIKTRKYWQWQHRDSVQFRPNHKAIDGKVFPADHSFFQTAYPPCFPSGTLVATPTGWKAIETIQSGELVVGGSGNSQLVTAAHVSPFNGNLIRIISEGFDTAATPNHCFLTVRGWVRADNLKVGDVLIQTQKVLGQSLLPRDINQLESSVHNCFVSSPVKARTVIAEALNTEVQCWNDDINPEGRDTVVMNNSPTGLMEMFYQQVLSLGWFNVKKWMQFWLSNKFFFALLNCSSSSWANLSSFTLSAISTVSQTLIDFFHYQGLLAFSSFRTNPLSSNSFTPFSGFNSKMLHELYQGSVVNSPQLANLTNRTQLYDITQNECVLNGYPFNVFNSFEDFLAWSRSHCIFRKVEHLSSILYTGEVYNLSVENDETYCLQASVVHNCGFGCRCAVFALSDRDLEREGLKVSTPPDPRTIADPGFKNFPANLEEQRSSLVADAIKRLPDNLAKLLQQDVEFQEFLNFAYNPNQPRDERGRFGRGSHAIAQPRINPDNMSREEIATYIDDVSTRANRHMGDTSQGDWFLRELARDQGFDGLPHVVTKEQMDEYAANGERELFRGLDSYGMRGKTGEDLAEQFRTGDLYAGLGLSGSGTYVAYGADKYDAEGYMGAESEGAMLRMTLKLNAKTISIDELDEMQSSDPIVNSHPQLRNLGSYATFKGYDAIDVGASQNRPKYMIILNRTAVRVQDESIMELE